MRGRALIYATIGTLAIAAAPASAASPAAAATSVQVSANSTATLVDHYYQRRQYAPIWFRAGAGPEAIGQLLVILRRAPIDGLANGPALAAHVEAAVAKAQGGDAAAVKAAELAASTAWVDYVQTIEKPVQGLIYGDTRVAARVPHAERVLALAQAAPQLSAHLLSVSNVNPIYAQLREAAVTEAAANGGQPSTKLLANLERARALPAKGKFILVDIASARLHMYQDGREVDSMKVVVGKNEYPTPMIASTMYYAVMNPYWHVPEHLIRRMLPRIIKGPEAFMKREGYEVISDFSEHPQVLPASSVDWKAVSAGTAKVILRQLPGGENSMGRMKFPFPNPEGIYLHDTPLKQYFAKASRDLSNGCVRVEDYRRLARFLFNGEPPALASDAPEQAVALPQGVPIYLTYLTLRPEGGQLVEVSDIYGHDRAYVRSAASSTAAPVATGSGSAPN